MTILRRMDFLASGTTARCRACQVCAWTVGAVFMTQLSASSGTHALQQAPVHANFLDAETRQAGLRITGPVSEITFTQAPHVLGAPKITVSKSGALKPGYEPPTPNRNN